MKCYQCERDVPVQGKVSSRDSCPHCSADAHACLNCDFYDRNVHNQCREPQAEWTANKERNNYCEYFKPTAVAGVGGSPKGGSPRQDKAKQAFEDLFG